MLTGFLIYFQGLGESFSSTMKYIKSIPTKELIEQIVEDTNEKAKMEIMQFCGMDEKTLSGVYAELSNHITVFALSLIHILQKLCTYKHIRSGEKAAFTGLFITFLV